MPRNAPLFAIAPRAKSSPAACYRSGFCGPLQQHCFRFSVSVSAFMSRLLLRGFHFPMMPDESGNRELLLQIGGVALLRFVVWLSVLPCCLLKVELPLAASKTHLHDGVKSGT